MDWDGWNAGKDRKGDQVTVLTFTECHVQAISERAIHVYSRPRKMRLAFPTKVPMQWTLQGGRVVENADVRIGDELVSASLPKWLRDAKLQEIRDATEEARFRNETGLPGNGKAAADDVGRGSQECTGKASGTRKAQAVLFQDDPAPHVCGNPCPRMACPECAELWRAHEAVLARVAASQEELTDDA